MLDFLNIHLTPLIGLNWVKRGGVPNSIVEFREGPFEAASDRGAGGFGGAPLLARREGVAQEPGETFTRRLQVGLLRAVNRTVDEQLSTARHS